MSVLLLTILGSLLLAAFFVAAFALERASSNGTSRWQHDSLLPLEEPDEPKANHQEHSNTE